MRSSSNDELSLSHVLFVDVTLIFCEANAHHLCNLCCLFLCFEGVSGLKINLSKSKLAPIGVVEDVEGLSHILGSRVSSLPMKVPRSSVEGFFQGKINMGCIIGKDETLLGWLEATLFV